MCYCCKQEGETTIFYGRMLCASCLGAVKEAVALIKGSEELIGDVIEQRRDDLSG